MKRIALSFNKPQIEINGIVFDVLKSDAAIVGDMLKLDEKFAGRDFNDSAVVLEKNAAMLEYLNELLGAGAVDKIVESVEGLAGYGLGLGGVSEILTNIAQASAKAYSDAIAIKYDE